MANLQGSGTLSIAGSGKVIAGPGISVTGGSAVPTGGTTTPTGDTVAPTIVSIAASGIGISGGTGNLNAGDAVTLTVTFSEAVTVSGGTPNLVLNDGGNAAYSSGSGSTALVFSHTVQAGQNIADLAVTSLSLNGATVKDTAGNLANTVAAAGYNPAGTLRIDTTVPTVSSIAASGPALTAGGGTVGVGATVIFTVSMSEAVSVTGTPSLSLSSGGKATYHGRVRQRVAGLYPHRRGRPVRGRSLGHRLQPGRRHGFRRGGQCGQPVGGNQLQSGRDLEGRHVHAIGAPSGTR